MEEVTSQPQEQQGDAMGSVSEPRPQVSIPPQAPIRKKGKGKGLWIIVLVAIIGLAIFLISRGSKIANEDESSSGTTISSPSATPAPSPTEEPAKREDVSIEILNGTGIAKEASYLEGKLKALGYDDITSGNADSQDNETTKVTFSSSLDQTIIDEITSELEGVYKEVDVSKSGSTSGKDVKIVTGLRKGQTPKPEASSSPEATSTSSPTASPTPTPTSES